MMTIPRERLYTWYNDAETPDGRDGVLAGLSLAVKDLFHIKGIPTGAGNPDWLRTHAVPDETAEAVQRLLDEGARLRGKTVCDELAYSLNGSNKHYGTPPNPKTPDRLPGGSSSGSAAAVALGEADIGLGTDTGGSVRVPAAWCGLYGLRTTHDVVSTDGLVPLAPRFDTVGWLTASLDTMDKVNRVLLADQGEHALRDLIVVQPEIDGELLWHPCHEDWLEKVRRHFHNVTLLPVAAAWWRRAGECFRILQGRQIWRVHGEWIEAVQPDIADDIRERLKMCAALTETEEQKAETERIELAHDIQTTRLPDGNTVAALPTTPGPAPLLDADPDWMKTYRQRLLGLTAPAGLAGLPQLHLPLAISPPEGVSLLGGAGSDSSLVHLAMRLDEIPFQLQYEE
ncbi:MAG: amidase [Gammaproteobacteria bacterium]